MAAGTKRTRAGTPSTPGREWWRLAVWLIWIAAAGGCAGRPANPDTTDVLFFVPGAAGDGGHYDGLIRGLRDGGVGEHIEVVTWGAPGSLMVLNFQDHTIHDRAETKLAEALRAWRASHPDARISVVAHSAGCGVTLGALWRDGVPPVETAVLLNPSVSPTYDLTRALHNVTGKLHVFHSDRDTFFLAWRTGTFGTYDNVKTRAAGNVGFALESLPAEARAKVVQHARDPQWETQGNDGGHFGTVKERFVRMTVAPLLLP